MTRTVLGLTLSLLLACGGDATNPDGPAAGGGNASSSTGSGTGGDATTSVSSSSASAGGGNATGGSTGSGDVPVTCPQDALASGLHELTIDFGGTDRAYDVQIPASYDNTVALPLLFDLHGYGGSKSQQGSSSGFAELAESVGFIVVRPQGTGVLASWNAGDGCCGNAQNNDLDDVGLMRAIADAVQQAACVDPGRIYATGLSNGGAMSHRLACEAADVFAAVAPVSYPLDFDPFDQCQPARPIPVMHAHGTSDLIVPYNGSFTAPSTPESFAYWASVNGCTADPILTFEQGSSRCETYDSCADGVSVTLCTVSGGHVLYNNSDDVPIAEMAWDFLSSYTLP